MNNLKPIIDSFLSLKNKGWINGDDKEEGDAFFPICDDLTVKCMGSSGNYLMWLFTIEHGLESNYCSNEYNYSVEVSSNIVYLVVYKDNSLILRKSLMNMDIFEETINSNIGRLALIYLDYKTERKNHYYCYKGLKILRLKRMETFIKLLNQKIIRIRISSKSVIFKIAKNNIEKLYKIEYSYDDELKNFLKFLDN